MGPDRRARCARLANRLFGRVGQPRARRRLGAGASGRGRAYRWLLPCRRGDRDLRAIGLLAPRRLRARGSGRQRAAGGGPARHSPGRSGDHHDLDLGRSGVLAARRRCRAPRGPAILCREPGGTCAARPRRRWRPGLGGGQPPDRRCPLRAGRGRGWRRAGARPALLARFPRAERAPGRRHHQRLSRPAAARGGDAAPSRRPGGPAAGRQQRAGERAAGPACRDASAGRLVGMADLCGVAGRRGAEGGRRGGASRDPGGARDRPETRLDHRGDPLRRPAAPAAAGAPGNAAHRAEPGSGPDAGTGRSCRQQRGRQRSGGRGRHGDRGPAAAPAG